MTAEKCTLNKGDFGFHGSCHQTGSGQDLNGRAWTHASQGRIQDELLRGQACTWQVELQDEGDQAVDALGERVCQQDGLCLDAGMVGVAHKVQ